MWHWYPVTPGRQKGVSTRNRPRPSFTVLPVV
jgi:hypothetical protein